jgi:hypothetical protein
MDYHTVRMISNNLELTGAVQRVMADSIEARPLNTRRAYDKKRDESTAWCRAREFSGGSLVTEAKLVLYLQTVVLPRGNGRVVAGAIQQLSAEGLEGYVNLWLICTAHNNHSIQLQHLILEERL